jgi:DNA-binding response OmpR family regulator
MRTPLNHIIGYSELLLEEAEGRGLEDLMVDLRKIRAAGQELLALIEGALDPEPVRLATSPPAADDAEVSAALSWADADHDRVDAGDATAGEPVSGHVLVVDDDENNRDILSRLLERKGYGVSMAGNGARALELLRARSVDLVLLDVMMPVMDGIETCRRIKGSRDTRLIPVVIMTALGQVEYRVQGIRAGADDFLTKPVDRNELLARIETSLRLKEAVREKVDRFRGAQAYLAKFVPQSVLRRLEEQPDAPVLEKTEQDVSSMFVDVSDYTRLSEDMRHAADFMVEKYFSRYLDAIHARGGDVTETSGDGLMAIFPGEEPKGHAIDAVSAALEILCKTGELNAQLEGILEPISVHIGINSGIALIGPTKYEGASGTRWTYTALGPAVNLAARIASVAGGGMIWVGPQTARRIEGRFTVREVGRRRLKNVKGEVLIHEVVGAVEDVQV